MRTYEGLTQSRAGDETLAYTDLGERMLSVYLTDTEKAELRALLESLTDETFLGEAAYADPVDGRGALNRRLPPRVQGGGQILALPPRVGRLIGGA